jgi:predicted N-acetyltransferase YhbS
MLSQRRAKAELYTQYPLSSLLIYNGATILHFLLGGIGIILGYSFSSWAGYAFGALYLTFSFAEMYVMMPLTVCPHCVYYRMENSLCISGLNVISKRVAKKGEPKDFPRRREEDMDAIVDIDAKVLGQRRPVYYERKCALALDDARQLVTSLVAEQDDQVIGFIMGNVYLGEFGIPETTASLDTIGVHPDYQGQGLAIELMKEFVTNLEKAGVERIYTLVNWNDWDLLRFFEKSGFVPAKMLNLELQIT